MNCKLTSFADGELQVGVHLDLEKIVLKDQLPDESNRFWFIPSANNFNFTGKWKGNYSTHTVVKGHVISVRRRWRTLQSRQLCWRGIWVKPLPLSAYISSNIGAMDKLPSTDPLHFGQRKVLDLIGMSLIFFQWPTRYSKSNVQYDGAITTKQRHITKQWWWKYLTWHGVFECYFLAHR